MKHLKKSFVLLLAAALTLVLFLAGISVSKFVFDDEKQLVGSYTDFVLSHNGEGQAAVLQKQSDGSYTGYIAVTVSNYTSEKISKREVAFKMRSIDKDTESESITDAWGNKHPVAPDSGKYTIEIADESGKPQSGQEEVLRANEKNTVSMLLKITRQNADEPLSESEAEHLTVVLETSAPYRDLQVFSVSASAALLSVGVAESSYQGYIQKTVNLKSAVLFAKEGARLAEKGYLAEITVTLEGGVIFDAYRFEESYGNRFGAEAVSSYTFTVRPGADMYLYFYLTGGSCRVKITARIEGISSTEDIMVSGVNQDNIVFDS